MISINEWLNSSFNDYRRKIWNILIVSGVTGAISLVTFLIPIAIAGILTFIGVPALPIVWALAVFIAIMAVLWFSTWGQVAATLAAMGDESLETVLQQAWKLTPAFAWVLTLAVMPAIGGFFIFIIPGIIISVLIFFAPFYLLSGEANGWKAIELSCGRVQAHFLDVFLRLVVLMFLSYVPRMVPLIGWLIMIFWAPFTLVALSRLAANLQQQEPQPISNKILKPAIIGFSGIFLLAFVVFCALMTKATYWLMNNAPSPIEVASRIDPQTAQSVLKALEGNTSQEEKSKAIHDVMNQMKIIISSPTNVSP